jgi:AraC-like DNA-binding protein
MLNQYNNEGRKSYLLLITYFPEKIGAVDPRSAMDGILTELCIHRLCARIGENTYAVMIPSEDADGIVNTSENLIAAVESALLDRFGDIRLPEFATCTAVFGSSESSEIERMVDETVQFLTDRKKAAESNYIDYRELIYRLRRNIVSQPQRDWEIENISHDIGISKSHLQRLYKLLFSTSIKDDVINSRIKRAMQLLEHTDMRIAEIAEQCGYNNENHFMRQFKEKTGMTAAQFRREKRLAKM